MNQIAEDIYYRNYNCNFWDCFSKEPLFFLFSEKAQNYWMINFYISLAILICLAVIAFFLVEKKSNLFLVLGIFLIVLSFPFWNLNWILSFFEGDYIQFFTIFFVESKTIFVFSLFFGLAFLGLSLAFKFWDLDLWKNRGISITF